MGTYNDITGQKKSAGNCIITAIEDFGRDILKASEIEYIDLEKMQKKNMPIVFFMINVSIDKLLAAMKERIPEMVPPIRKHKTKEK